MQLTLRKNSKSVNGSGYGASGATVDKGRDFDIDILSGVNASGRYLNFSVEFWMRESDKNCSPYGIALRVNNSTSVESVFHGARPVK
jgi:hypothetical protein